MKSKNQIFISATLSKKQAEYWYKLTTTEHRKNATAFKLLLDFYIEQYERRLKYASEMNRPIKRTELDDQLPGGSNNES